MIVFLFFDFRIKEAFYIFKARFPPLNFFVVQLNDVTFYLLIVYQNI